MPRKTAHRRNSGPSKSGFVRHSKGIIPLTTVELSVVKAASPMIAGHLPELCAGDRLTRAEFERRYVRRPWLARSVRDYMKWRQRYLLATRYLRVGGLRMLAAKTLAAGG